MSKTMKDIVINVSSTETRIAILEDKHLVELYVERPENERMVGDIYLGEVENVIEAVQAAFVDVGLEQNGFLPFSDVGDQVKEYSALAETINKKTKYGSRGKQRQFKKFKLKSKQKILVQVTKEPIGTKGTRLTTELSLPGRFLVLVPGDNNVGVSRKIVDGRERRRLRMLAKSLKPDGFGLIIRTVAVGKDTQLIKADLEGLLKTWKKIEEKAKNAKGPMLIHKDVGMASSVIRDLFSPDIDSLIVDSRKMYGAIRKYLKEVAPTLEDNLTLFKKKTPIFDQYSIEDEIEKSLSRKIWMKSGGYIIYDHTEALTVVDVNSGRSVNQKDHELNALRTDVEAAHEIARQLRLRDIGGIIVIDFIDLREDKHRKKVVNVLTTELNKDRAAFDILPMNDFGLVSLTRERVRPSLLYRYSEQCPRCGGLGRIPAKSTLITKIERRIQQIKNKTGQRRFILKVHPDTIDYLTEGMMSRIRRLMLKYFVSIKLEADITDFDEHFELVPIKDQQK